MRDDRDIDRLFQESFKDFEVDAPSDSWNHIRRRLTKKSDKKPIPLWQKLSAAAAVVGVLILVGSQWFLIPSAVNTTNSVVDTPQENTIINSENSNNSSPVINDIVQSETNGNSLTVSNLIESSDNTETSSENAVSNNNSIPNQNYSNPIIDNRSSPNQYKTSQDATLAMYSMMTSKEAIQHSKIINADAIKNNSDPIIQKPKKSLIEVAQNIMDTPAEKQKTTDQTWFVKPQISPVFYGNLGSGSALDSNLSQNSSQGEINLSYGVNVAYKLNKRIKIRTGINRLNLNYTTNDVFLVQGVGLSTLNNVNANSNFNASVLNNQQLDNLTANGLLNRSETLQSELKQELGYIEIPMEIEYKLFDKKIGVNIIGGASTLLLNNNNLDIQSINGTTSIGEANNLNNFSFSTNLAIGLDYDISKRLMLNLEPTFKYQFNTFQSGTADFQPYFIGIYSGIIFKF